MNRREFLAKSVAAATSTPVLLALPTVAAGSGVANVAATVATPHVPKMSELLHPMYLGRAYDLCPLGCYVMDAAIRMLAITGPLLHGNRLWGAEGDVSVDRPDGGTRGCLTISIPPCLREHALGVGWRSWKPMVGRDEDFAARFGLTLASETPVPYPARCLNMAGKPIFPPGYRPDLEAMTARAMARAEAMKAGAT